MYQKVKKQIQQLLPTNKDEDIGDRYMFTIISVLIAFLSLQGIIVLFIEINLANTAVTFLTLLVFIAFLRLFKTERFKQISKILFIVASHIAMAFFWISSEGLFGAMTSFVPIVIFIVVSILPLKNSIKGLFFTFFLIFTLIIIDLYFPTWIVHYESLEAKRVDIIIGVLFTSILTGFSFLYLKQQYESKEIELKNQFERQKKLNEELDNFVYRTSHDLRAPISSTLGLISLIQMSDDLAEIKSYVALQEKSMHKMDAFIIEILNYSRNSRMEVMREEVSFQEIYDNALSQVAHIPTFHKLKTTLVFDEKYSYFSDKLRLQILFNNIISNAFRYFDEKKENSFLAVEITHTDSEINIEFKDNGIGIDSVSVPKIFDMFYRAHRYSVGSGVGLYIVKQSVEKMGGTIVCKSAENMGTTFRVSLPNKAAI
jgi:signal transduction histidine kinase